MMQLHNCLLETSTSHLRAIAAYRKIYTGENPSRAQVISVLMKALLIKDGFTEEIILMTDSEHEIVHQIRDVGGVLNSVDLEKSWGSDDHEVARRWFWHEKVSRGLARLRLAGILFLIRDPDDSGHVYALPNEYLQWFNVLSLNVEDPDYAPYTYFSAEFNLLSDIFHLLQYFELFRVRALRNGKLPKRHKKLLLQRMEDLAPAENRRDIVYIDLIFRLVDAFGFLNVNRGVFLVSPRSKTWFERSQLDQVKDLFQKWMNMDDHVDIETISETVVESAGLRHPMVCVKRAVVDVLKKLPEQWVTLEDISIYFQKNRSFFYRPDHSVGLWRLTDKETRKPIAADMIWNYIEKRIIKFIITKILGSMGLIDVGLDKDKAVEGVFVTPIGRAVLLGDKSYREDLNHSPLNRLIIQSDFEIIAPTGIVLSVRDRLEKVAEFICGGHMQRYRLSRNSIARAMETGMKADEIIKFLESASREDLPGNVRTSLSDWTNDFGKIRFNRRMLVTTEDKYLMQEILSRPATKRLIEKQIGPAAALVADNDIEPLIIEMKRAGYLPKINEKIDKKESLASISLDLDPS
ncbi:helicase-associated domain-containing protein, partial [bacterium]|nr:helicase-associated domain-containing protein [bacterium]